MSCVAPISIKQKLGNYLTVPCGRCYGCLKRKRSEWLLRLESEHKDSTRSLFLTLTYQDQHLPFTDNGELCFNKEHLQNYFKRLRKKCSFRYYVVSEYGGMYGRPHYHALFFNYTGTLQDIERQWKYGFVHIGDVTSASINYCAAYVITKEQFKFARNDLRRPFSLTSRNPGLGANYIDKMKTYHRKSRDAYGVRRFGEKVNLPRYYADKIFSKVERQALGMVQRQEVEMKGIDPVLNFKDWRLKNPKSSVSVYYRYRQQLIQDRTKKVIDSLKQIRDVQNF